MISVIVYGRNDNHGYNLPRRAALSLNCIAHVLSEEDEILFVDYNTPDDLPTFPEAISDTLTPWTRKRLRVLRVRPRDHAAAAAATRLPVVEPIARNVALRRSRPSRWILSTNTDMLFIPNGAMLLQGLLADLEDGFYQLPRFELPEGLWESLDRSDPARALETLAGWRARLPLDERVYADGHTLFDGPGDFQLFLRDDLFAIDGFDERMVHGWHVDANIARRMALRGRSAQSLEHLLAGYHCDHTRQASIYHGGERAENSSFGFVDNLASADLSHQRDKWGLPGVDIEEIELTSSTPLLRALDRLQLSSKERLTSAYSSDNYGALGYDAGHVAPFVLDQLLIAPSDARIGYAGARRDLLDLISAGLGDRAGQIQAPPEFAWLAAHTTTESLASWEADSDIFVFEIGANQAANQADVTPEEARRLGMVDQAFTTAAEAEVRRQAAGRPPRKFIIVNAINNYFERQVQDRLAVTLTPYSSRVRHGFVVDRVGAARRRTSPALLHALDAEGIYVPPGPGEVKRLRALADAATEGGQAALRRAASSYSEIKALAASADITVPEWLLEALDSERPSRSPLWSGLSCSGERGVSRLLAIEDWDNAAWLNLCQALFPGSRQANLLDRDPWFWARTSIAAPLLETRRGLSEKKVLIVSDGPEHLAFSLASLGCHVHIADLGAWLAGGLDGSDWTGRLRLDAWVPAVPIRVAREKDTGFDAALVIATGRAQADVPAMIQGLAATVQRVAPKGIVGLACQVQLHGAQGPGLSRGALVSGEFASRAMGLGLQPVGFEQAGWCPTPRTVDRSGETDPAGAKPLIASDNSVPAVLFLEPAREGQRAVALSRPAEANVQDPGAEEFTLGSIMSLAQLRSAGRQTPIGISGLTDQPLALGFDFRDVPAGDYELLVEISPPGADVSVRVRQGAEFVEPTEQTDRQPGWRAFQISLRNNTSSLGIEIGLRSQTSGPITVSDILIR